MAEQSTSSQLNAEQIRRGITRIQKRIEEITRFDPTTVTKDNQYNIPELEAIKAGIDDALERTFGSGTSDYKRYQGAKYFPTFSSSVFKDHEIKDGFSKSKERSLALLKQAVKSLEERLAEAPFDAGAAKTQPDTGGALTRGFRGARSRRRGARSCGAIPCPDRT